MRSYRSVPHRGAAGTIMHVRSCMYTSIQYYRADRATVEMHDGAAVRSTPLLASAGGQSTATRCIKGRKHCHNKASQFTEQCSHLTHTCSHARSQCCCRDGGHRHRRAHCHDDGEPRAGECELALRYTKYIYRSASTRTLSRATSRAYSCTFVHLHDTWAIAKGIRCVPQRVNCTRRSWQRPTSRGGER